MSHVDLHSKDIPFTPKAIAALSDAVAAMGGALVKADTFNWWGTSVGDYPIPKGLTKEDLGKCEYRIEVPGTTWHIGVIRNPQDQSKMAFVFDFYGSRGKVLQQFAGADCNELTKQYQLHAVAAWAKSKGRQVSVQHADNGSILVQCR